MVPEQFQPILSLVGLLGAQLDLGNKLAVAARSRSPTVIRSDRGPSSKHLLAQNAQFLPLLSSETKNRTTEPPNRLVRTRISSLFDALNCLALSFPTQVSAFSASPNLSRP